MLTNEEIIKRYGNHPESKGYYPFVKNVDYISCFNCPVFDCALKDKQECDGYEYAYDKIRTYLAAHESQTPDHTADVAQTAEASVEILYLCDRRACEVCDPNCRVTKDIRHAKHFELMGRTMVEVEPKPPTYL